VDLKLEVVILPVSDVDRAKQFYKGLGWREDADIVGGEDFRIVQLTPPGSECSISFGVGVTTMAPGTQQGLLLVTEDIEATRAELVEAGAPVSEVFHGAAGRFHRGVQRSGRQRVGDPGDHAAPAGSLTATGSSIGQESRSSGMSPLLA
jgi:catechol 2,3-dioxygenase-like lactoylglutathione lyase family enzyme